VVHDRRWTWFGFAYGCVLFVFAFVCAGSGHGSYLPFAIYGAPLSVVPVPVLFMFVAPVWWGTVGKMLASRRLGVTVIMMILHEVAAGLVLWLGTPMDPGDEQWRYFSRAQRFVPAWLWGGITVYLVGQVVAWWAVVASVSRGRHSGR
jgi:hypothetical protein